jgi:hypothetical protein
MRWPLYICKHNLEAEMDKEDFGLVAVVVPFSSLAIAISDSSFLTAVQTGNP